MALEKYDTAREYCLSSSKLCCPFPINTSHRRFRFIRVIRVEESGGHVVQDSASDNTEPLLTELDAISRPCRTHEYTPQFMLIPTMHSTAAAPFINLLQCKLILRTGVPRQLRTPVDYNPSVYIITYRCMTIADREIGQQAVYIRHNNP